MPTLRSLFSRLVGLTMKIKIEWLTDCWDCDTCGWSSAEGARVYFDDKLVIDLTPVAHCFNNENYDDHYVFDQILQKLGHTMEIV